MKIKDGLHGTVKLIFQPGEEGAKGACAIVAHGHLDDVDYFAGTHIAPTGGPDDGDVTPGTWGSLLHPGRSPHVHHDRSRASFPDSWKQIPLQRVCDLHFHPLSDQEHQCQNGELSQALLRTGEFQSHR